jgi:hypothetical protein
MCLDMTRHLAADLPSAGPNQVGILPRQLGTPRQVDGPQNPMALEQLVQGHASYVYPMMTCQIKVN